MVQVTVVGSLLSKSFIYNVNTTGRKIEPCGTPTMISKALDSVMEDTKILSSVFQIYF